MYNRKACLSRDFRLILPESCGGQEEFRKVLWKNTSGARCGRLRKSRHNAAGARHADGQEG